MLHNLAMTLSSPMHLVSAAHTHLPLQSSNILNEYKHNNPLLTIDNFDMISCFVITQQ